MRPILCTLILLFGISAHSQVIRGVVLDKETEEALINANVYFNGTFRGTMTDTLGHFSLNAEDLPKYTLVVSSLGYYSESIFSYNVDEMITVYLSPKTLEIEEVLVIYDKTAEEKLRKKGIKEFKKEFLGNTYNARKCEIQNLKDVQFKFSEDQKSFDAYADKPLLIYNGALGYSITYHLDYFSKNEEEVAYRGTHFFVEDTTKRRFKTRKMKQRREQTYKGSRMHFFRSLYSDTTEDEGFVIRDSSNNIVSPNDIITEPENLSRYLTYKGYLCYYHFPNINNKTFFIVSFLNIKSDSVLFTQDGYFDPSNIIWSGRASKKRVGNLLPFEYEVNKK